jgi:hypothetical protein
MTTQKKLNVSSGSRVSDSAAGQTTKVSLSVYPVAFDADPEELTPRAKWSRCVQQSTDRIEFGLELGLLESLTQKLYNGFSEVTFEFHGSYAKFLQKPLLKWLKKTFPNHWAIAHYCYEAKFKSSPGSYNYKRHR